MPFVVSGGQLAQAGRSVSQAPMAVRLSDTVSVEYAEIWRRQRHVRTVVSFLGRNIAQLGLHVFRRVSDLDRERASDHPVSQLLAKPNPYTTTYRWVDALVQDLAVYDVAYQAKVKLDGQPAALVRLDPRHVRAEGDSPFAPEKFVYQAGGRRKEFPADQVLFFRGYSPVDPRTGCSPIESLRELLAEAWEAEGYRQQLWTNGARMSGYIKRPAAAPKWSDSAKLNFAAQWREQYTGDGANPGGTPILEDGMEWVAAGISPEAAQYIEARKLTREEVTAAYHIPPQMIGILDNANYSNMSAAHKQMYADTLGPWLQMIQQEIALQLLPDFPSSEDLYVEFLLAEKLKGSFEEQATQLQTAVGAPYMTRNEARARMNLAQIDGGDELVTPLNVIIGGQASPTDSAPPVQIPAEP